MDKAEPIIKNVGLAPERWRVNVHRRVLDQNYATGGNADGGGILIAKCTEAITIWQNSITDNHAENWGGGISIQGTLDVQIDWNDISNNDAAVGDGISLWAGDPPVAASALITNNGIIDNQGDGIYISDSCSALIGGNRDNANDIFGNTEYAVRNDSTNTIDATYNYWGTIVEAEIRDAIWDYYDDNSKGVVDYEPWLDGAHIRTFPFAQTLSLDGDEDYVQLPSNIFDSLNEATVEGWVRWNEFGSWSRFVDFGSANHTMYIANVGTSSTLRFKLFDQDGNGYVDGKLVGTNPYTGSFAQTESGENNYIGKSNWDHDADFYGQIDEVRVWSVARTQEQIQSTMNTTLQGDEPGLVGYWNFDDGTANDSTLNGNHGTREGDAEIVPLYGTWPPPLRGDLSGDGTVSAYDAALILRYVVGLIDEFPADSMSSPSAIESHDYEISIPKVETSAGEGIQVPIGINDAKGLLAGGITIKYDSAVLRAIGYGSLELLNGYYWKANTNLPGEVRFAFATTEVVTTMGQGNLLMVEFEVLSNTEGRTSPLILENVNLSNSLSITKINGEVRVIPSTFALLQNFPNPFNPDTWLPYKLASASPVSVSIYNAKGQLIRTLHLGYQNAGVYVTKGKAAYWDGKDNVGEKISSGLYFYTLQTGEFTATRKMVIVK